MTQVALLLMFAAALLAFKNWRHGFALCVVMALAQDPLRKLAPGQPLYFILLVGVVFAAAWLGAKVKRVPLAPGSMLGWRKHVGVPFTLFIALIVLQATHSLARFGNPVMTAIGVMSYLAPIPAVVLAYRFALGRGENGLRRWMKFYAVLATLALGTVFLEFLGFDWRVLGEVGGGVMISGAGAYYKGNAGIFRAAEIAAWHAATVACFAFMLLWGRRFSAPKVLLALAFIGFLLAIGALTGRRKMIIEVTIFLSAFFCLVVWFQRGNAKLAVLLALVGLLGFTAAAGMMQPDAGDGSYASERVAKNTGKSFAKYSERAATVYEDAPKRVAEMGIQPIYWAVEEYGWLGAGVGVGSQGAGRFGGETSGAAEGGLGKLTVELGLPGLLVVGWLLFAIARYVGRILALLARTSPGHASLGCGFVAFMIANAAAFTVATQAYADIFILLSLGWTVGFLIALPVLADREFQAAKPVPA